MLSAGGGQHRGCIIPQAVTKSSVLEDGRNHRPKYVELIRIINKPLLLHLVGAYVIYINDELSNKYKINKNIHLRKSLKSRIYNSVI